MSSDAGFKLGKYGYEIIPRKMNKEDMRLLSSVSATSTGNSKTVSLV